ncbi:hypothetical protein J6590_009669 [Homalodisca vitripennis]|nr:hypothetical protein J6590_009669 [Homalodisca vitripennis]
MNVCAHKEFTITGYNGRDQGNATINRLTAELLAYMNVYAHKEFTITGYNGRDQGNATINRLTAELLAYMNVSAHKEFTITGYNGRDQGNATINRLTAELLAYMNVFAHKEYLVLYTTMSSLRKSCGASIKTDENITRVTVCNEKHSGDHPPRTASTASPDTPTVPSPACSAPGPDPATSLTAFPPASVSTEPEPTPQTTPEDAAAEIARLKKEIERLNKEFQGLQPTRFCGGRTDLLDRLRTTIEVLEAENQILKQQLKTCECADFKENNSWTREEIDRPFNRGERRPARTASEPRPCCEVLIAGTNDLTGGRQRDIYRHLEGYIVARSSSTEIILTTLPHRHDLDPTHPVHYQTVLVNAYIEELAARHNIRVLNFDDISRRYFMRHGQHLSWRGKRLLAGMIVVAMRPATQEPEMTAQPRI